MLLSGLQILAPFLGIFPVAAGASQVIRWDTCPDMPLPQLQCGNLSVPIDHSQPHGPQVHLFMTRVKGNGTKTRGTMFVNPGGPGGSGAELAVAILAAGPALLANQLLQEYDIVGVDPRGVGSSSPVQCDPKLWNNRVITAVTNDADYAALVAYDKAAGESCAKLTGPLFNHLDTVNVAKDFELVRQAIGDDKFNFIGLSYGSQIGYTYAEMFPSKVGRMVLDGIVDHSLAPAPALQSESGTYEATLQQFFAWCGTDTSCALHGQDIRAFWNSLLSKAQSKPLPAPGCQQTGDSACHPEVTYEDLLNGVQPLLATVHGQLGQPGWAELSQALLAAEQGNATLLSAPFFMGNVDPTGTYASFAIGCQDWLHPAMSAADIIESTTMTSALSPLTRGFSQSFGLQTRCLGWPSPLTNQQRGIGAGIAKAPPILLVNAFWDPETSVQWAVGIKQQIPGARLIFRKGSGHTSYRLNGDTAQAINTFLLQGQMPSDGLVLNS